MVSSAFSKLYYACVVNDSGDRTVSFYKRRLRVSNKRYKEIITNKYIDFLTVIEFIELNENFCLYG